MITLRNANITFYGNRGMTLEEDINLTNEYYKEKNIALIYKKPIPIKVLKINSTKTRIQDAFYEKKSTLDYSGIYREKYIEFDAKETNSKTSFPLANIHEHQIEHIKNVIFYKGIAFLIVRFNLLNKTFLLEGTKLIEFIDNENRKSIPISFFEKNCKTIELKYRPRLDYLKLIDIL
ncbi:MAG: Holliday junction resolvase RecU [Bacilli bacterium]|nr:Holliday junction resolvase RecU [Bacilli bacterium]